jgi:SAM-dependent methyltransferase
MELSEYGSMFHLENEYWWYKGLHELVEHYIRKIEPGRLRIFDAGCGTGRMMELLGKYGRVKGVDYSEEAITLCKRRNLSDAVVADLNEWQGKSEEFDAIVSLDVIYHEAICDDLEILCKFHKTLVKNGTLILNLVAFNILKREHDLVVGAKKRYRKKEFKEKLQKTGFLPVVITYRLPYLFLYLISRKFGRKVFNMKTEVVSDLQSLPPRINHLLTLIIRLENKIITSGLNMPFGSSLFVVARKT